MTRLSRSRSTLCSLVAVAVFSLAGQPLSAQAARQAPDASTAARAASAPAAVLATDESARVGVARAKASADANVPAAAQPSDNTVKWAIIIGIAVLAALLIVALAD